MKDSCFLKRKGDNHETIYIKPYEEGVTLAQKVNMILALSDLAPEELARVLGKSSDDILLYALGADIPDKVTISAINKLFRLWYELRANVVAAPNEPLEAAI